MRVSLPAVALFAGALTVLAVIAVTGDQPARAATITVTTTDDELNTDGDCSLREAIEAANSNTAVDACAAGEPGEDTIVLPVGAYILNIAGRDEDENKKGDLDILDSLAITGAGAETTTIDGNDLDRIFQAHATTGNTVSFSGVTMLRGAADTGSGGAVRAQAGPVIITDSVLMGNTASSGAAIYLTGNIVSLSVNNSTISGNSAGSSGGGLYDTTSGASISITNSSFHDNSADSSGGGLYHTSNASITITDSTFSDNSAANGSGGAVYNTGGGQVTVTGSTFQANTAGSDGGALQHTGSPVSVTNSTFSANAAGDQGGAVYCTSGNGLEFLNSTFSANAAPSGNTFYVTCGNTLLLKNTILADSQTGANCTGGTVNSMGHNLASDSSCGLNKAGDMSPQDPLLGPLADNGGPTQTHALLPGSPAIDAGSDDCPPPSADQRGVERPLGPKCDIGAYELSTATPTPSPSPSPSPTPAGDAATWGALLCGAGVGSTDALAVLVVLANLSPLPHPDCPAVDDEVTVQQGNALARPLGAGAQKWGDVNCSGAADSIDALAILLFVAHLPAPAPPAGCAHIGDEVTISTG